jgi:hypothetical protein
MKKEIKHIDKQFPSIKIMTTEMYRQCIRKGLSTDGYNLYLDGKMGYAWTRLSYNAMLQIEDEEGNPFNVVKAGHPLPGIYKIVNINGLNDTRSINREGHGYHHSSQILSCYYSKCSTTDFVTEETVDIFAYPLWQSVAARDVDRLDVGDVFEVLSFDLIENPYKCYRLQWTLISKSGRKSIPYSCATEGDCLPQVNTSKTLISELRRVRDEIAQEKGVESFWVFSNKTLEILANKKPQSFLDLLEISGIGDYKMNTYGGKVLYVIKCFKNAKKKDHSQRLLASSKSSKTANIGPTSLKEQLRQYRIQKTKEEGIPAYCILTNDLIDSIATDKPTSRSALLAIHGFGPTKYDKYGDDIIRIVKKHSTKSSTKGETIVITIDMYYQGMSPDEIAIERGLSVQTIYNHLFKANVIDPCEVLSQDEYEESYIYWENLEVSTIQELYGPKGVAAFYFIKNNSLY